MSTDLKSPTAVLEQRIAFLEDRVRRLEARLPPESMDDWLASFRVVRSEEDAEAFEEMLRLGREFRKSHRYCDTEPEGA